MFKSLLAIACSVAVASAQYISIRYPPEGASVVAGSNLTVQLVQPDYIENVEQVAVVIGLQSCPGGAETCFPPSEFLSDIVYSGPYDPQYYPDYYNTYQNFTVQVPSTFEGNAQLGILRVGLVGASGEPIIQYLNETLNVVSN